MKIRLVTVGKTDVDWVRTGISIYRDRLSHYVNFSITELPDIKNAGSMTREQVKTREGELILKQLGQGDYAVLLDEKGREFSSSAWAAWMQDRMSHLSGDLVFIIGGAFGFSDAVYARGNAKLALSQMTFSHQMVRVIFTEQLYRGFTIIRGEPYHHE